jgi:ABC-type uncharacterized transport system substrate-binding protein
MRRRDFIKAFSGCAAAWPLTLHAQEPDKIRQIGVITSFARDDPESQLRHAAFVAALQQLGWADGRNVRIEYRWVGGDTERRRTYAAELVAHAPDVILATGTSTLGPLLRVTRTVPIVFVNVTDPVGSGFVESLNRPGGNATGFTTIEYGTSGKFVELLKQIAPRVKRVAVLRDSTTSAGIGQLGAIQSAAPSFGVEVRAVDVRDAGEIEHAITAFARGSNGGLIALSGGLTLVHRELIITLAARHQLPAIYPFRYYVRTGGLISYGPETIEPYRRAAIYIDRILKGEKPAELPVQAPTKYELVINLKAAKALGLEVPPTLLARADEVIE